MLLKLQNQKNGKILDKQLYKYKECGKTFFDIKPRFSKELKKINFLKFSLFLKLFPYISIFYLRQYLFGIPAFERCKKN